MTLVNPLYQWGFYVYGKPVPKGSKRPFTIKRKDGKTGAGAAEPPETIAHEQAVAEACMNARARHPWILQHGIELPVIVTCRFSFAPPKRVDVRRRATRSRPALEPLMIVAPDTDKLLRTVLDAMNRIAYRDDAQVFEVHGGKSFADHGEPARTVVEIAYYPVEVVPGGVPVFTRG